MKTTFTFLSIIILTQSCTKKSTPKVPEIEHRFFTETEFNDNYSKEMVASQDVYYNMKKEGLIDDQLCKFDFDYVSDSKDKLDSLKEYLTVNFGFQMKQTKKNNNQWSLWGEATEFPVNADNLLYWTLNLYYQGYKYDSKLSGYGATVDSPKFIEIDFSSEDYYFDKALAAYNKGDLGTAIIDWSTCIKINPKDPNSYYSRAIAKDELYTWKSALKDYDKAIEIAPDFIGALVNRGASRDESGDYTGAIDDYTKVIELEPSNAMAYLNRGNSNFNLGLKEQACSDWEIAADLGDNTAAKRLNEKCQ